MPVIVWDNFCYLQWHLPQMYEVYPRCMIELSIIYEYMYIPICPMNLMSWWWHGFYWRALNGTFLGAYNELTNMCGNWMTVTHWKGLRDKRVTASEFQFISRPWTWIAVQSQHIATHTDKTVLMYTFMKWEICNYWMFCLQASRTNQRTMFTPPKLTILGVFKKLKEIAKLTGNAVGMTTRHHGIAVPSFVCCLNISQCPRNWATSSQCWWHVDAQKQDIW